MPLTVQQLAAIDRSLAKQAEEVVRRLLSKRIKTAVESLIQPGLRPGEIPGSTVETGFNPATARAHVREVASGLLEDEQIDFALTTARDVAQGAGVYAREAADPEVVDAYPAWELLRIYDRDVPRGYREVKGVIVEVPGDDWPSRFRAAAQFSGDYDAARILESTGRMIALKASPIWQALGDGAGGYTDTLGNPFAPFAFNSGYDLNNVGRAESIELGLLRPGQAAPVPEVDLTQLFAPLEAAA